MIIGFTAWLLCVARTRMVWRGRSRTVRWTPVRDRVATCGGDGGQCGRTCCTICRVQVADHRGGQRSYVVLDVSTGVVRRRAERFLAGFGEDSVGIGDLRRYMALCAAEFAGPLGRLGVQHPSVTTRNRSGPRA